MRIAALLALLLAGAAPTPVAAPEPPAMAEFEAIGADLAAGRFAEARARIERVLARPLPPVPVRELQKVRANLLLHEGRRDEAMAAFAAAEAVEPGNADVALYQLDLATERLDATLAMAAVDRLIERFPDAVRTLEPHRIAAWIDWLNRNGRREEATALFVRLAGVGFGGDDLTVRDAVAVEGAAGALSAGRLDQARALVRHINSRSELTTLLIERRFSALWPDIEARVGPHMATAEAAAISEAEATAARRPDSVAARHGLMQTYYLVRRYRDADRVGAAFARTRAEMRALGETDAWLVNDHALILHAMGRADAADARFAAMRAIDIEDAPWLISMVINRVDLLVTSRRWRPALARLDEAASLAERHGSPYSRQLVRSLKLCTVHALGRAGEAAALLAELRAQEAEFPAVAIDGLICTGRIDEAEPVLVRWLGRPEAAGPAIAALQPRTGGRANNPSIRAQGWEQLRQRPAVRHAFHAVGRVLPEAYWPPAAD